MSRRLLLALGAFVIWTLITLVGGRLRNGGEAELMAAVTQGGRSSAEATLQLERATASLSGVARRLREYITGDPGEAGPATGAAAGAAPHVG